MIGTNQEMIGSGVQTTQYGYLSESTSTRLYSALAWACFCDLLFEWAFAVFLEVLLEFDLEADLPGNFCPEAPCCTSGWAAPNFGASPMMGPGFGLNWRQKMQVLNVHFLCTHCNFPGAVSAQFVQLTAEQSIYARLECISMPFEREPFSPATDERSHLDALDG